MSAMDLLLDQVQTWELPTGACPFLKTCTKALQFSPKWRCNFLHFYFATFGTFILQQTHISKSEMNNMSLFTYTKAYLLAGDLLYRDVTNAYIEGGLFASVGVLAILVALCALGKKPILMFIMNALMGGAFYLINWDVVDRRIMPDSNRVWGIAHVLYWPLVAILAVCAIWLFIGKRQDKKANN